MNNLSDIKKLQLELDAIKSSRQYKVCTMISSVYNKIKLFFNKYFNKKILEVKKKYKETIFYIDKIFLKDNTLKYKKAIILGNAKNLKELTSDRFLEYENNMKILTIGLNRSFYNYNTNLLLWADYEILNEINESDTKNLINTIVVQTTNNNIKQNLLYWKENKSFKNYPYKGLFKARNILVSALHLCYIHSIKEIELFGFEFDSRDYFFDTNLYNGISEYEIKTDITIEKEYLGYDTQKIVKEVIEFMLNNGYSIKYNGKSNFLESIKGLIKND